MSLIFGLAFASAALRTCCKACDPRPLDRYGFQIPTRFDETIAFEECVPLTASTPIVIKYSLVLPSTVSNLQQMVPTGMSL